MSKVSFFVLSVIVLYVTTFMGINMYVKGCPRDVDRSTGPHIEWERTCDDICVIVDVDISVILKIVTAKVVELLSQFMLVSMVFLYLITGDTIWYSPGREFFYLFLELNWTVIISTVPLLIVMVFIHIFIKLF
jgi:hypothetical protein